MYMQDAFETETEGAGFMQNYILLIIATFAEVVGDSMMKLSAGFKRKWPLVGVAIGYLLAFYLMSLILESMPLGSVYTIWTGLGVALTAVVGALFWHERFNAMKAIGLILVIAGVVVLESGI